MYFQIDTMTLKIMRLSKKGIIPTTKTAQSAGYDLFSPKGLIIKPGEREVVWLDIAMTVPEGTYGRIAPKSGLALESHLAVNGGVIDRDYTGNIGVILINHDKTPFIIYPTMAIAQMVLEKIEKPEIEVVDHLEYTGRNIQGFGSTVLHFDTVFDQNEYYGNKSNPDN